MSTKNSFKIGEDYTICDMCDNYERSASGTIEICHAKRIGSEYILHMPDDYVNERLNGEKTTCKEFKRCITANELKEYLNK